MPSLHRQILTIACRGGDVPYFARALSSRLWYVGREQNEGRVCATWGFPDPETMEHMLSEGTGVFVAHDLRLRPDAYSQVHEEKRNGDRPATSNDVFFDAQLYAKIQSLYQSGARFFLVRHPMHDSFTNTELPQEILEWDKHGVWVRPDQKERLEKIDTIIAMYGSHAPGTEKMLREQIKVFSLRMKKRFGAKLAYIHGKGPGVMYIADDIARNLKEIAAQNPEYANEISEDIFSIGVGISVERVGQSGNFHPHAQADFQAKDRLVRQMIMNDRATFNVFNIGGAGTLEEIAITLCSMKLHKNVPTPMIFVDTHGLAQDGGHLWKLLRDLVTDLSAKKVISDEEKDHGIELLQPYMSQLIHIVDSYDDAADIIEQFADDPIQYYLNAGIPFEKLTIAYEQAIDTYRDTHFRMPDFLSGERILDPEEWSARNAV